MKTWTIIVLLIFTHILFLSGCTNSEEVKKEKTETAIEKIDSTAETNMPEIVILVEEQMNYSAVGEVLADDIINPNVENVDATSLSSTSSVATIYDIVDGHADLAVIRNDLAYFASHGFYLFEGDVPITGFHGLATLYPEVIHIVVRPESGIQTVDDLVGKRVAVGNRDSVLEVNAKQILNIHGITYEDFEEKYMDRTEIAEELQSGKIDAAFISAGLEMGEGKVLKELSDDVDFISVNEEKIQELQAKYPYYVSYTISKDWYETTSDVTTLAIKAMLIVNSSVDEDLVYEMTRAMFENLEQFNNDRLGLQITLDGALDGMPLDVHLGAERYFNEQQLIKKD
ncbi:TAXI family TRAP transporter solute-binding subunit [Alkalihalobacterium sp. APHAB7]|uniref:TAXI family TRAP transporter solute-binding subunit n=1 Tax=Alkalihalobacterium sp. APHAB7 TaxID=3402081 RepID=UPI003AAD329D